MSGVAVDNNELELDASLLDSVGPGAATADGLSTARSPEDAAETHPPTSVAAAPAAAGAGHPRKRALRTETCPPRKQSCAFGPGKFVYDELGEAYGKDQYTCGAVLSSDWHMLAADFYSNALLTCAAPVESTLYNLSSSALKQPFVNFQKSTCCICGVVYFSNAHCRDQGCPGTTVKQWRAFPLCGGCTDKGFKPLTVSSTKGQSAQRACGQKRSLPAKAADPDEFALTDEGKEHDENDSDVSLV